MKQLSLYHILQQTLLEYLKSDPKAIDAAIAEIEAMNDENPKVFIEASNIGGRLWIGGITSTEKGVGNATKAMSEVCKIADKHNVIISLQPLPYGKDPKRLNKDQLIAFYKKFGFKFEEGEEDFGDMERFPNQKS